MAVYILHSNCEIDCLSSLRYGHVLETVTVTQRHVTACGANGLDAMALSDNVMMLVVTSCAVSITSASQWVVANVALLEQWASTSQIEHGLLQKGKP